jgi:hypothetical protein
MQSVEEIITKRPVSVDPISREILEIRESVVNLIFLPVETTLLVLTTSPAGGKTMD